MSFQVLLHYPLKRLKRIRNHLNTRTPDQSKLYALLVDVFREHKVSDFSMDFFDECQRRFLTHEDIKGAVYFSLEDEVERLFIHLEGFIKQIPTQFAIAAEELGLKDRVVSSDHMLPIIELVLPKDKKILTALAKRCAQLMMSLDHFPQKYGNYSFSFITFYSALKAKRQFAHPSQSEISTSKSECLYKLTAKYLIACGVNLSHFPRLISLHSKQQVQYLIAIMMDIYRDLTEIHLRLSAVDSYLNTLQRAITDILLEHPAVYKCCAEPQIEIPSIDEQKKSITWLISYEKKPNLRSMIEVVNNVMHSQELTTLLKSHAYLSLLFKKYSIIHALTQIARTDLLSYERIDWMVEHIEKNRKTIELVGKYFQYANRLFLHSPEKIFLDKIILPSQRPRQEFELREFYLPKNLRP